MRPRHLILAPGRADVALAAGLSFVGEVSIWGGHAHGGSRGITASVAFLIGAALVYRRRVPVALAAVFLLVSVVAAVALTPLNSLWALVVLIVVGYSVAAYADRREAAIAGALVLAGTYVTQLSTSGSVVSDKVLAPLVLVGAPWVAGRLVRRYGAQSRRLQELNAELESRRALELAHALEQERARIAHELHDVIAHSISVMIVQAGAAEQFAAARETRDALESIRRTGKSALGEMRRLLGILQQDIAPGDDLHPQPGVAELPGMIERIRAAGVDVALDLDPALPALQPGPDLVVYRVVQEALTNTLKHAGRTAARVRVRFDGQAMQIEAIDDGGPGAAEPPADAGHGLVGMRERLALYDGRLDSGPTGKGGWRVTASLPLGPEALR